MKPSIKILIVEHDPIDVELMHHELQKSGLQYTSQLVSNEKDFVEAVRLFVPDIILSDYTFPSFSGPLVFSLRQQIAADTPFIFVSGTIGEERSIELIKNGVTDFCLKGNLKTLNRQILRALQEATALREKREIELKLSKSESRLARAQEVAHIGHWEYDFKTHDLYCSDEIFRIYEMLPSKRRQSIRSFISFIHPEDAGVVMKKMHRLGKKFSNFSITFRILLNNGAIRYVYLDSKIEVGSTGDPIGMFGVMHNVTKKILLEQRFAAERTKKVEEITQAVLTAQENERSLIEKELHDNINQILGATKLFIELARVDEDVRETCLDKSIVLVKKAIDEIRNITKKIAVRSKQFIGLFDSMRVLIADLSILGSLDIHLYIDNIEESDLDDKLQLNMYRIVQEQLNNILKHAFARNASIILTREKNEIVLFITDDGLGYDTSKKRDGVGIRNIMSRAALCNGVAEITSHPGSGFQLKITFRLREEGRLPPTDVHAFSLDEVSLN